MSDDDRKKKARDEDEDAEKSTGSDEADEADESDEEEGDEAEAEGDDGEKAEGDDDAEAAAAQRVAAALGVTEGEEAAGEKAEGEDEEAAAAPNRAARRAEASQRRKKRKAAAPAAEGAEADEAEPDLPKDKNARAKELLKRRREQAAAGPTRPVQLLPSEMVDDALSRSASATGKWLRKNFSVIQWVILGAIVAGGGYTFYLSQTDKKVASASDVLVAGVRADRGRVMAEDKRSDEEKEVDPTKVFKTAEERADTALASFRKVESESAGTGAAILAKLGEGGALLDKRDYNGALQAYSAVTSSTLAAADADVKARALEGLGFAKEGKKDYDGAITTFKELAGMGGYKELGQYHEARMLLAKGEKDKAKDLLKQVYDALEKPSEVKSNGYLKATVEDNLRRIDPSLVPQKPALGGGAKGSAMNQEELERALKKLKENLEKQAKDKDKHE